MTHTATASFKTELATAATSLLRLFLMTRVDGTEYAFTSYDVAVEDFLGRTWDPIGGFDMSALEHKSQLDVDNAIVRAFFTQDVLRDDINAGRFDGATLRIYLVNPEKLANGSISWARGWLGKVTTTNQSIYQAEFRGFLEHYRTTTLGELYGPLCREVIGGPRCRIPIEPPEVAPLTAYGLPFDPGTMNVLTDGRGLAPSFVLVRNLNENALTVTNPGAETGTTGWTNEVGTLTTDTTPTPQGGSNLFKGTDTDTQTKAYQDIAIPGGEEVDVDAGRRAVRVSWYQQSTGAGDDQGQLTVRFFDGAPGSQIGAEQSPGLADGGIGSWTLFSNTYDIPALTRTLRIAMDVEGNGVAADAFIDDISVDLVDSSTAIPDYEDRVYEVTTAGTTGTEQPDFDTIVGNTTAWGTAVFTAREGWMRAVTVDSVSVTEAQRVFTVTELTPNGGGSTIGRDYFPDDALNGGGCRWITGNNAGLVMEIKSFTADDGITIEQDIDLFDGMPFAIQVGDTALVWRGCDGTMTTCAGVFGNGRNQRAEKYIPGRDFLFTYPDARF